MCDEQIRISSTGSSVWVSHNNNKNQSQSSARLSQERKVASYVQLYSQARLDTLDALDKLVELSQAEELKSKLLFSIIVVSVSGGRTKPSMMNIIPAVLPFCEQDPGRAETQSLHSAPGNSGRLSQ